MTVNKVMEKMIVASQGSFHDINHFLKVWAYARNIGMGEKLDEDTQKTLEIAAIVHDISCPSLREKYGNADGKKQEEVSSPMIKEFFADTDVKKSVADRIDYMIAHHHTYTDVDGIDLQILLEADFLVNAQEMNIKKDAIEEMMKNVFKTETGIRYLKELFLI